MLCESNIHGTEFFTTITTFEMFVVGIPFRNVSAPKLRQTLLQFSAFFVLHMFHHTSERKEEQNNYSLRSQRCEPLTVL